MPGLLLEEATALVRFRIKRRAARAARCPSGTRKPETPPLAAGGVESVAPAPPLVELVGAASAATAAPAGVARVQALVEPAGAATVEPAAAAFPDRAFAPFPAAGSAAPMEPAGRGNAGQCRIAGAPDALSRFQERPNVVPGPEDQENRRRGAAVKSPPLARFAISAASLSLRAVPDSGLILHEEIIGQHLDVPGRILDFVPFQLSLITPSPLVGVLTIFRKGESSS